MNFRKNRVPMQGMTNFHKTDADWSATKKNVWTPIEQVRPRNNQVSENASPIQKSSKIWTRNRTCDVESCVQSCSNNNKALQQIRKAYKNTDNVWRMAKSWQFSKRGFITLEKFKHKMQNVMGVKFTDQQLQSIGEKFGTYDKRIDVKNFLSIAYGEAQTSIYKPKLFNILDRNKLREQKIDNLVDKLDIYEPAFNKTRNHQSQTQAGTIRLNKNQEHQSKFNKTYKQCRRKSIGQQKITDFTEFNKQQFQRLNQQSFKSLKQSARDISMHPNLMLNLNQTKTRFGATTCNAFRSNQNPLARQQSQNIFMKQVDISQHQRTEKKLKMLNRIQKIRQMEKAQKQNIEARENKEIQKQSARIYRKKLDRQAYQYSSFIRNKWL